MINLNLQIDAEKENFDVERLKQKLQEFMEITLAGYYDFSICSKDPNAKPDKKLMEEAIWVVNLFDQANTGGTIETLGDRGKILKSAIDDLRKFINKDGKLTILTNEEIEKIESDRKNEREEIK